MFTPEFPPRILHLLRTRVTLQFSHFADTFSKNRCFTKRIWNLQFHELYLAQVVSSVFTHSYIHWSCQYTSNLYYGINFVTGFINRFDKNMCWYGGINYCKKSFLIKGLQCNERLLDYKATIDLTKKRHLMIEICNFIVLLGYQFFRKELNELQNNQRKKLKWIGFESLSFCLSYTIM